ncbi:uncharacterized protein hmw [Linepithema humile]|uniref:uncharacterized protein hmw n=1 Tax=Linepithema humile TaxID=83485 RepID=UPI00351F36E7
MSNPDDIKAICECQYVGECTSETKNCNNTLNIHEIDEEDSETEATTTVEQSNSASDEEGEIALATKNAPDDESAYVAESFYSDESCDGSDITNVTSRSLNSSLLLVNDLQNSQCSNRNDVEVDELRWEDDESCQLSDEPPRAATADRLIKSRRCRRWNMSFTDEEMRRIERENELLLRKIMAQQKPRYKILGERTVQPGSSSSAINRRRLQKKIDDDNLLLLKRIQQAKSCVFSNASKTGCRLTFL